MYFFSDSCAVTLFIASLCRHHLTSIVKWALCVPYMDYMFWSKAYAEDWAEKTASLIARRLVWLTCCRQHCRFPGRSAYVPDIRGRGRAHRADPTWELRCDCPASYFSNSLGNQAHLRQTTAEGRNVQLSAGSIRGDSGNTLPSRVYVKLLLKPIIANWRTLIVMSDRRPRESVLDKRRRSCCCWRRWSGPSVRLRTWRQR